MIGLDFGTGARECKGLYHQMRKGAGLELAIFCPKRLARQPVAVASFAKEGDAHLQRNTVETSALHCPGGKAFDYPVLENEHQDNERNRHNHGCRHD